MSITSRRLLPLAAIVALSTLPATANAGDHGPAWDLAENRSKKIKSGTIYSKQIHDGRVLTFRSRIGQVGSGDTRRKGRPPHLIGDQCAISS